MPPFRCLSLFALLFVSPIDALEIVNQNLDCASWKLHFDILIYMAMAELHDALFEKDMQAVAFGGRVRQLVVDCFDAPDLFITPVAI